MCGSTYKTTRYIPKGCFDWSATLCRAAIKQYNRSYSFVKKEFCDRASSQVLRCADRINMRIHYLLLAAAATGALGAFLGHITARWLRSRGNEFCADFVKTAANVSASFSLVAASLVLID